MHLYESTNICIKNYACIYSSKRRKKKTPVNHVTKKRSFFMSNTQAPLSWALLAIRAFAVQYTPFDTFKKNDYKANRQCHINQELKGEWSNICTSCEFVLSIQASAIFIQSFGYELHPLSSPNIWRHSHRWGLGHDSWKDAQTSPQKSSHPSRQCHSSLADLSANLSPWELVTPWC